MNKKSFSNQILGWYQLNKRDLPWRKTKDPYKIWISEIILQQTRVNQGLPYYLEFIKLFPSVIDLAQADEETVLHVWQGLGYYSRARNMHKCANYIVDNFHGIFPGTYEELLKLPGIGPYTAAAISSISFSKSNPVIDGNVFRVLARVFGIKDDTQSTAGMKTFKNLAEVLIPDDNPGDYNQAIMEYGALHCTPSKPGCNDCVFSKTCYANKHGIQSELPVKKLKTPIRKRRFIYFVFENNHKFYFKKRLDKDIWHGLYEFYLVELRDNELKKMPEFLQDSMIDGPDKSYIHKLTHQEIRADFYHVKTNMQDLKNILDTKPDGRFYNTKEIDSLPKPVLINKYLKEGIF